MARKDEGKLRLKSGHFYVDRAGYVWCCYQIDSHALPQGQADCIRVDGSRKEYFYIDGRYDSNGKREHTLVRELAFKDAWIDETYEVHDRITR